MPKKSPNNKEFSQVLQETVPNKAAEIIAQYDSLKRSLSELTASLLYAGAADSTKETLEKVEDLRKNLIEAKDPVERQKLADNLHKTLSSLNAAADIFSQAEQFTERISERRVVPAGSEILKAPITEPKRIDEIYDAYTAKEQMAFLKEASDSLEVSERQKLRVRQIDILKRLFGSLIQEIEGERSSKEWHQQTWRESVEETGERSDLIKRGVKYLDKARVKLIKDGGLTLGQVMIGFVEQLNAHYAFDEHPEFNALFKNGELVDVKSEGDLMKQYSALVEILRWRADYAGARDLVENDIFSKEFADARDKIDRSENHTKLTRLKAEAIMRIDSQIEREGVKIPKKVRDGLIEVVYNNSLNKEFVAGKNEGYPFKVSGVKAEILEQYRNMMDSGDEWLTLSDEMMDTAIREILVNVPLILASGGTAYLGRVALSKLATSIISSSAKLSGALKFTAATLTEGAIFATTYEGLEGKNLFAQDVPVWASKILLTSVTLGAIKGADFVGKFSSNKLAKMITKFPDKSVAKKAQDLIISGNLEAATVFTLGVAQHYLETGMAPENLKLQLFHSYVAIGAIKVVPSGIVAGKKLFRPAMEAARREIGKIKDDVTLLQYLRTNGTGKVELMGIILPIVMGATAVAKEYNAHIRQKPVATQRAGATEKAVSDSGEIVSIDRKTFDSPQSELFRQMEAKGVKNVAEIKKQYDKLPAEAKPFVKVWAPEDGQDPYVVIDEAGAKQAGLFGLLGAFLAGFISKGFTVLRLGFAARKYLKSRKENGQLDVTKLHNKLSDVFSENDLKNLNTLERGELKRLLTNLTRLLRSFEFKDHASANHLLDSLMRLSYAKIVAKGNAKKFDKTNDASKHMPELPKLIEDAQKHFEPLFGAFFRANLNFFDAVNLNKNSFRKRKKVLVDDMKDVLRSEGFNEKEIESASKEFDGFLELIHNKDSMAGVLSDSILEFKVNFWRARAERVVKEFKDTHMAGKNFSGMDLAQSIDFILREFPADYYNAGVNKSFNGKFLYQRAFLSSYREMLKSLSQNRDARGVLTKFKMWRHKHPVLGKLAAAVIAAAVVGGGSYVAWNGLGALWNWATDERVPEYQLSPEATDPLPLDDDLFTNAPSTQSGAAPSGGNSGGGKPVGQRNFDNFN